MAEERLDVVVDPTSAKRGIDVLIGAYQSMAGAAAKAQSATTQLFEKLNSGFKTLESSVLGFRSVILAFGSVIAAFTSLADQFSKFQSFVSAMSIAVGSTQEARAEFNHLMGMADKLGISITSLSRNYGQLSAAATSSGMTMMQVRNIFESFSVAARVMHMSNQDTSLMFYALTQMVSKGVVSMEELRRQLGEKLPGAMNIAANSVGVDMKTLEDAIRKGSVNSAKFLPIFAEAVRQTFGTGLPNAMRALDAEMNRLSNNWQKFILVMFDLGVADAFTNVIKELNRIMSDKVIAEQFARAIKSIADGVTEFLRTLSGESIRRFITEFANGVKLVGETITDKLLPFLREVLSVTKEILAVWLTIKGVQAGAAIGGLGGARGAAIGGVIGGLAGAGAAGIIGNRLGNAGQSDPNVGTPVRGRINYGAVGAMSEGGAMDMGVGTEEVARKLAMGRASLKDVLNEGGRDKEQEKQLQKYNEALLSLQKTEADGHKFIMVSLDIQAGKYNKLTEAQRQNLLTRAAIFEQDKSKEELQKTLGKDNEKLGEAINREQEAQRERASASFEKLQEDYMTEEQLLLEKYKREMEIIDEAERLKMGTKDEWDAARMQAEMRYLQKSQELEKKGWTERQKFEAKTLKEKAQDVFQTLESITAGVAQHNKVLFQINKVAGIANAIMNAHEGASKTLAKYPWPLSGILAAIHYAAGIARVQAIASTSFNGGGAGNAPSVGGSTPAQPVTPVDMAPAQNSARGQTTTIKLEGEIYSKRQVRELLERLNEDAPDGSRMVVT